MPRAGTVDKIKIYQTAKGNWREMMMGRDGEGRYGILASRPFFGTQNASPMRTKTQMPKFATRVRAHTTQKQDYSLRNSFRTLSFLNNPNLYTAGKAIGYGKGGLAMMVASQVTQTIKNTANVAYDVVQSMTGESRRINNAKNTLNAILDPVGTIVDSTYGGYVNMMETKRSNIGMAYYRSLTGNIINSKDKGKY